MFKEIILKYGSLGLLFFAPLAPALLSIFFIVMMDMLTGLFASYKLNIKITSKKLSQTVLKSIMYLSAILVAHVCEKELVPEIIPMTKICLGLICLTEVKSIFENINKVIGVNFWDYVKEYFSRKKN